MSRTFLNRHHAGDAERKRCDEAQCGPYLELFTSYVEGAAARIYRDLASARNLLRPFFLFLNTCSMARLDEVTAGTITAFKVRGRNNDHLAAANDTSALSTFFEWATMTGLYGSDNPVIPALHAKKRKPRMGRPYSSEEKYAIRQLLRERGNLRLRAFLEIAAGSGMRADEMCRLRLHHVSPDRRELFVALPNKTMTERIAYFYNRAEVALCDWLQKRKVDCRHDYLFTNYLGHPLRYDSIRMEFRRTLCIECEGVVYTSTGLQEFSLHRLRHTQASTLASNGAGASTIMTCTGWVSAASIDEYVRSTMTPRSAAL